MQQRDLSKLRARTFRKETTPAEAAPLFALHDRRFMGLKFRRQVPPGPRIADFFCAGLRLVIEPDGDSHDPDRDGHRDRWMRDKDFRALRPSNRDIPGNPSGCPEWLSGQITP